ncbi:MAG: hypothetical protein ACE5GE_01210 [Phycisphaerae bacterium]
MPAISPHHHQKPALGRFPTWLIDNGVYLALLTAVVWVAIDRWDGRPAKPRQGGGGPTTPVKLDPENDRTDQLIKALDALPPLTAKELPAAPQGWTRLGNPWGMIALGDALRGTWAPKTRPNLQAALHFVLSAEVQSVLAQLEAVKPGAWRGRPRNRPNERSRAGLGFAGLLFAVRARYYAEEASDADAALADLTSIYKLAAFSYNANSYAMASAGMGTENLAQEELRFLVRRHLLSRAQYERMQATIAGTVPEYAGLWTLGVGRSIAAMQDLLDGGFTKTEDAPGFLAINHWDRLSRSGWARKRRSGIWNLASVFFNDRSVVARKIELRAEAYRRLGNLPYASARERIVVLRRQNPFITDGPICAAPQSRRLGSSGLSYLTQHVAGRNATLAALALSAFRGQHGRYPEALTELDLTNARPVDPYCGELLRYARVRDGGFVLYSVGPNLTDDGGRPHRVDEKTGTTALDGDYCFHLPRPEPAYEPQLVENQ